MTKGGSDTFGFASDYVVPNDVYYWSRPWQRAFRRYVLANATHVIAESGQRLFGNGSVGGAREEFAEFRRRGIRAAHLFHGSDIRPPSIHRTETSWSPFWDADWPLGEQYELVSQLNSALVEQTGAPVFVSTPDLLSYVDRATWLPLVPGPEFSASARPTSPGGRLRVVHAPSSSRVKGSDLIEPTLWALHEEGVIEYVRIRDAAHFAMPGIYRDADVVLDQFRIGSYGLVAVEAMASGRTVIGHVTAATRSRVESETGLALPILEADPESLEGVLRRLQSSPAELEETAGSGVAFVSAVHAGTLAGERLAKFLSE